MGSNVFNSNFEEIERPVRIEDSYSGLLHAQLTGFAQQPLRQTVACRYIATYSLVYQRFDPVV